MNKETINTFLNKQFPKRNKTKPAYKNLSIKFDNDELVIESLMTELKNFKELPKSKVHLYERALRFVIANLILDMDRKYWLVIERDNRAYLEHSDKWFRAQYVNFIIDTFIQFGFVQQVLGNSFTHEATKIIPTMQFRDLILSFGSKEIDIVSEDVKEKDLVIIDSRIKKMSLRDQTALVKKLNNHLSKIQVRYSLNIDIHPTSQPYPPHKHTKNENPPVEQADSSVFVSLQNMSYKQVFGENETEHGRLYAPHQNLPKIIRHNLEMFSEKKQEFLKTVELDYSSTHLKMIYDKNNIACPDTLDFYSVPGYSDIDRSFWKQVAMRAINCTSFSKASESLIRAFNLKELTLPASYTSDALESLLEAFVTYHNPIKEFLFLGNMQLMNLDSKIAIRIIERFIDNNKPILSIHDSFVVLEEDQEFLFECMEDAWQEVLKTNSKPRIKIVNDIEIDRSTLEAIQTFAGTQTLNIQIESLVESCRVYKNDSIDMSEDIPF